MEHQDDLKKAYNISFVVGIGIISSLFICVIVVLLLKSQPASTMKLAEIQDFRMLRYVLYALSVGTVIILRILRGMLLRTSPSDTRQTLIPKLQRTSIITMAMSEGPAIFGLVLFLLVGSDRDFYILFFVSLVLIFMYFPRLKNWEAWLEVRSI